MVKLVRSKIFMANVDMNHARYLKDIEEFYKHLKGIEGEVGCTELLRWMIRVLWIMIVYRRDDFEKMCRELVKRGII